MDQAESNKRVVRTVVAVLAMLFSALSQGLNIFSVWPNTPWNVFALVSFVVFCFLVWVLIGNFDSQLKDKTPNILLKGEPYLRDVYMYAEINGARVSQAVTVMTNVAFANDPKRRTDSNNANGVRAEITFLDENRNKLFGPIEGRWGQTTQPSGIDRAERHKLESVDFPNNGATRNLDFILKYPEDDYCYAFNNDSYDFGVTMQNPDFAIKTKRFFAQIILKGAYVSSQPWEFEVRTNGKSDAYEVRHGEHWQKPLNTRATKALLPEQEQRFGPVRKASQSS